MAFGWGFRICCFLGSGSDHKCAISPPSNAEGLLWKGLGNVILIGSAIPETSFLEQSLLLPPPVDDSLLGTIIHSAVTVPDRLHPHQSSDFKLKDTLHLIFPDILKMEQHEAHQMPPSPDNETTHSQSMV